MPGRVERSVFFSGREYRTVYVLLLLMFPVLMHSSFSRGQPFSLTPLKPCSPGRVHPPKKLERRWRSLSRLDSCCHHWARPVPPSPLLPCFLQPSTSSPDSTSSLSLRARVLSLALVGGGVALLGNFALYFKVP